MAAPRVSQLGLAEDKGPARTHTVGGRGLWSSASNIHLLSPQNKSYIYMYLL